MAQEKQFNSISAFGAADMVARSQLPPLSLVRGPLGPVVVEALRGHGCDSEVNPHRPALKIARGSMPEQRLILDCRG